MQWYLFAFTLWNCIKCNSLLYDACLILFTYDIQFHTFFLKNQETETEARAGWDRVTHLQVVSLVLAFLPVLDLVMVLAVIPLVQTGTENVSLTSDTIVTLPAESTLDRKG